ncbi:kinase-like domain-containing protein [Haematococcus lacustris]
MGGCCSRTVEHAEEEPGDVRPDFEPVQQLGRHDVWLCTCNASHDKMVIKLMQRPLSEQQAKFLADELLAQCRQGPGHVNLVKPRELVLTPRHLGFAMEYVRGGSLQQYVRGRPADEDLACYLFRQLLWLITYCTDNHVPNRDIKLDRLLLDTSRPPRLLLADFGVVKAAQALPGSAATPPAPYYGPDQLHSLLFGPPSQTPHPAGSGRDDPDSSRPTATRHAAQQGIRTMSSSRPQADKSGAAVGHPPPLTPRGPDPAPGAAALDSPFTRLLAASTAAALLGSSHPPSDSPPLQAPAAGSAQAPSEPSQGRRGGQEQGAPRITLSRSPSSAVEGPSTAWSRRFNSGVPQGVLEAAVAALAAEAAAEHEPQAGCTVPLLAQQGEVQRGGEAGKAAQQAGLTPVTPAPPTYSAVAHDVWAAGVVLATMLLGANPFSFDDKAGFGEMRDAAVRAYQPDHHLAWRQQLVARMSRGRVSEEAQDLVLAMLAREGEERLGVQLILEHPWMARTLAPQYELALEDLLACQDEVTERQRLGHYLASQREQDVRNMLALAQQPPPPALPAPPC